VIPSTRFHGPYISDMPTEPRPIAETPKPGHAMPETQRVAIVTGAAGGIGREMTRALLAAGIRVTGVDRDREPLEALSH
jgi:NADPH-dependent 2,4-dienoyl-CoA reductase/sulfur reductase-like enzyme